MSSPKASVKPAPARKPALKRAQPKVAVPMAEATATTARIVPPIDLAKMAKSAVPAAGHKLQSFDATQLYRSNPEARIAIIRTGVPAATVDQLSTAMNTTKEFLLSSLGLPRATISRKEKTNMALSSDETERLLGVASLIGKVQAMVEESGNPSGFDAARWLAEWLAKPLPALGGATPGSYMDTFEGQKLVSDLLGMSQSGAYA